MQYLSRNATAEPRTASCRLVTAIASRLGDRTGLVVIDVDANLLTAQRQPPFPGFDDLEPRLCYIAHSCIAAKAIGVKFGDFIESQCSFKVKRALLGPMGSTKALLNTKLPNDQET